MAITTDLSKMPAAGQLAAAAPIDSFEPERRGRGRYPRPSLAERFRQRQGAAAGPGKCREWTGKRDKDGYGIIWANGKSRKAHRVSWEMVHGPIAEDVVIRHIVCDNPPCTLLEHLTDGSELDNVRDRVQKGRSATADRNGSRAHPERLRRGEAVAISRLTPDLVRWLRSESARGRSYGSLGRELRVNRRTVMLAVTRATWQHIEDESV